MSVFSIAFLWRGEEESVKVKKRKTCTFSLFLGADNRLRQRFLVSFCFFRPVEVSAVQTCLFSLNKIQIFFLMQGKRQSVFGESWDTSSESWLGLRLECHYLVFLIFISYTLSFFRTPLKFLKRPFKLEIYFR